LAPGHGTSPLDPPREGTPRFARAPSRDPARVDDADGLASIDELDLRPGAHAGGTILAEMHTDAAGNVAERIPVLHRWVLPSDIARRVTTTQAGHLKIVTVQGTSMVPDYLPGDRVMVDTADTSPSPPGNFIVWDGLNLVIKFAQHLPHSDPPTVRLTSRHPDVLPYERLLDEACIQGRVIGKWAWS
jgi:hypothetical protein